MTFDPDSISHQEKLKMSLPSAPKATLRTVDLEMYELYRTSHLSMHGVGIKYGIDKQKVRLKIQRIKSWLNKQQQH
jgi:hypothetical protein